MDLQIYLAGHKDFARLPGDIFIPIHVGRAGRPASFCALGDDTGDHISGRNDSFCELTALYWIWKNTQHQSHVGLFHYRRHLSFGRPPRKSNRWGVIEYDGLSDHYLAENRLDPESVAAIVAEHDLILPEKWDVASAGSHSLYDHFEKGSHHAIGDYDLALQILLEKYPDYAAAAKRVNRAKTGYFTNMFVMRRDLFDAYAEWLFDILFELEQRLDISNYSVQERRIFGFIGEWLFNIYLSKLLQDRPELRLAHLARTYLLHSEAKTYPKPFFDRDNIAIVLTLNDNYVPFAGATILSIVRHANKARNYDILLFDGDISPQNKQLLIAMLADHENFSIRFISPHGFFDRFKLPTHLHISKETYYRLFIPEIFQHFAKVLYIDSDMIVRRDLALLYDEDLHGMDLAAVKDCVMAGFCKFQTRSIPDGLAAADYLRKRLQLTDIGHYLQAGLLVFDIEKSRSALVRIETILAGGEQFWFMDQDILNMAYQGRVHFIDMRWNVYHGNGTTATFYENLPAVLRNEYFAARQDPYIIHYAGEKKPWIVADTEFAEEFWFIARQTPWYEAALLQSLRSRSAPWRAWLVERVRNIGRHVINPFAPLGSRRRTQIRHIFNVLVRKTGMHA